MPQIINSFRQTENPLSKVLTSLGNTMFGDTLTPAINRQKLQDARREALSREQVAQTFGAAKDGKVDFTKAAEFAALGGMKPEDIAALTNYVAANLTGPRSDLTTNAMAGWGKYKDSAQNLDLDRSNAFNMNESDNATSRANNKYSTDVSASTSLANNRLDNDTSRFNNTQDNQFAAWKALMDPIDAMVNGAPAKVQTGAAAGVGTVGGWTPDSTFTTSPVPEGQKIAPMPKSKGMSVTTPDGTTIQLGGDGQDPPMNLTNANLTKAQGDEMAFRRFEGTLGMATDLIAKNPNSVGLIGQGRGMVQDAATLAQGAAQMFGINDIQGEMAKAQQEASQYGVNLDFEYDPAISQIESLMNILAFQGARAIGGQSGNDLSDKDVKAIKIILGDPTSLFTNSKKLLSRLSLVNQYVADQRRINLGTMGLPAPAAPPPAAPAPGAPPPVAAPGAAKEKWTIGPDGSPVRVQ